MKLFDKIKNLFSKKDKIKKFSNTTTDATEGSDSKQDLNPNIKSLLEKVNKQENINNEELNKLIEFYFNKAPINHILYSLNKDYSDSMCFEIVTVNTILNNKNDVENIIFKMKEVTFNIELSLSISIKDFHEFFEGLEFKVTTNT